MQRVEKGQTGLIQIQRIGLARTMGFDPRTQYRSYQAILLAELRKG